MHHFLNNVVGSTLALMVGACSSSSGIDTGGSSVGGSGAGNNLGGAANGANAGGDGNADAGTGNSNGGADGGAAANSSVGGSGASSAASGTDGGSSSTNATTGGAGGNLCEPQTSQGSSVPPILEFQVDITGSMTDTTSTTGGQSKWNATMPAMINAFNTLAQSHPDWAIGITFFNRPNNCYSGTQETTVPIAPLDAAQNQAIATAIRAQRPQGYTPTLCAWQYAFDQVTGYTPPAGSVYTQSQRYIVLMTDGIPTVRRDCCTLAGGVQGSASAISLSEFNYFIDTIGATGVPNGVQTFVIGVPGSEDPQGADYDPRYMLSQIADVGGTALQGCVSASGTVVGVGNQSTSGVNPVGTYCHIDLTTAPDFAAALESAIGQQIVNSISTCTFAVPPPSADYYLDLDHTTVEYLADPNGASGDFYLNDPQNATELHLCPSMCSIVQANPLGQVNVTFACGKIG
jgi:hypothetical protein